MSLRDVKIGQIILHIQTGVAYRVRAAYTATWAIQELATSMGAPSIGPLPIFIDLARLPEFRVIGQMGL
jgi:hypothetical protein